MRKGFNGLVKDVDTAGRTVTGYFSTFNFKDSDGDILVPGAFKKSIDERGPSGKNRIFHLWQHWTSDILGKPKILAEDKDGLYFETHIAKTSLGDDVLQLYMDRIINEHSIGFNIVQSERDEESSTTTIKEVKLWEGSTVTWGANENTPTVGIKAVKGDLFLGNKAFNELSDDESASAKAELVKHIERITKAFDKGTYTDDTFELLQIELNLINELLKSLEGPQVAPVKEPSIEELVEAFAKELRNG